MPTSAPDFSTATPATPVDPTQAETSEAAPTPTPSPTPRTAVGIPGKVLLEIAAGSEARYRVQEQLARLDVLSDAVGATQDVRGRIVLALDNVIESADSRILIDLRTIRSDERRRDGYIRNNTLETALFPLAEFIPREILGLPVPLPTEGEATFQIVGDMTIHGVTSEVTWDVTASFTDSEVIGTAVTSFPFGMFGMEPPRVFLVLSVADNIRLEIDFNMTRIG